MNSSPAVQPGLDTSPARQPETPDPGQRQPRPQLETLERAARGGMLETPAARVPFAPIAGFRANSIGAASARRYAPDGRAAIVRRLPESMRCI